MLEFKAYFCEDWLYIDERPYRCNEALTNCLNLPTAELSSCLVRLWRLVPHMQLSGSSAEQLRTFLNCVQQAQELFFRLGRLAAQLPFHACGELRRSLTEPRLLRLLDMLCFADDIPVQKIDNSSSVADIYFLRIASTLSHLSGADAAAELNSLNSGIAGLLEEYICLAGDLLQAQRIYSPLLDKYIHKKRAFLSGDELADCFSRYLSGSAQKYGDDTLPTSCRVPSSYELYSDKDGRERLCLACTFDRLRDFFYIDFFRGLERSCLPKRCDNCGQYFLLSGGKYSSYCERPLPDEPEKTCRSIGAKKRYGAKCKNDPVWLAYNRAYKAHYARYMKGKMTEQEFGRWSRYAVSLREQAADGTLGAEQYQRLIKE